MLCQIPPLQIDFGCTGGYPSWRLLIRFLFARPVTLDAMQKHPLELQQFLTAEATVYTVAPSELKRGCKECHWSGYKSFGRGRDHRTLALLAAK